jgi:uncharacterized membrane protein YhhN
MTEMLLIATCLVAILDWLAVWRGWRRLGYIAKPLTIILLFAWLVFRTGLRGPTAWFGIGLLFSLAGDVFLMLPPRFFMAGLASFSLVHLAYFIGFISPFPGDGYVGALGLVFAVGGMAYLVMRRITAAQISRGLKKLALPTLFYAVLISLMLLSALWTLFRPDWSTGNALLVSLGALLFYSSDLTNAWIRFVNPVRSGRVLVMVTYHLGQLLLMAGVVLNLSLLSTV